MAILSHQSIVALCQRQPPVIGNHDNEAIKTASYDMRAGSFYYLSELSKKPTVEIQAFDERHSTVEVPPNQAIWVHMAETLDMPRDLVGHLSLKVAVLAKGLIMASQSQIDATYRGPIFALLYNLSDVPVPLKKDDRLLRLEFATLDHETAAKYEGGFGPHSTLKDVVKKRLSSGIVKIQKRLDRYQRIGLVGIGGILVSLLILEVQLVEPAQREAAAAVAMAENARDDVRELTTKRERSDRQVERLRRRLRSLDRRVDQLSRALLPRN